MRRESEARNIPLAADRALIFQATSRAVVMSDINEALQGNRSVQSIKGPVFDRGNLLFLTYLPSQRDSMPDPLFLQSSSPNFHRFPTFSLSFPTFFHHFERALVPGETSKPPTTPIKPPGSSFSEVKSNDSVDLAPTTSHERPISRDSQFSAVRKYSVLCFHEKEARVCISITVAIRRLGLLLDEHARSFNLSRSFFARLIAVALQ